MIFKNNLVHKIKFTHTKEIYRGTSGDQFIDYIEGEAMIEDIDDGSHSVAGRISAHYVDISGCDENQWSLIDVLDQVSHTLSEYIPFFNQKNEFSDSIYKSLNIDLKDEERKIWDNDGVLIFDNLDVKKKYRGEGVGNLLLDSVCHDYRRNSRFALLKAFPLQYVGSTDKDLDEEKKAKIEKEKFEFKNRNFETSRKKLVELYKKSGFEIILGTEDFMVCDLRQKFD